MKISLGTAIYNHKPTQADMIWRSGFLTPKKKPTMCPIKEDTVENYVFAYDNGLCVKGYRFTSENDIWKRTFVCDFDNLNEAQYNRVLELIGQGGKLKRIQGRMSSGMKVEWHLNSGIPNWKPNKWKYKVFFPLDEFYGGNGVICIREEVERAYLDVVQFFNPWSERNKTEEIARLWLKANNQSMYYKHGTRAGQLRNNHPALVIEDPIFKDYILPDPVEVTNPRHQITYSVIPEMKETHRFLDDEDWDKILGQGLHGRFPATTKSQFTEIVNLPYDFKDSLDTMAKRQLDRNFIPTAGLQDRLVALVEKYLTNPELYNPTRTIPTSRSEMAKSTKKNEWKDLVMDVNLATKTNIAIYSEWEHGYDMQRVGETFSDICRLLVRCECERRTMGMNQKPEMEPIITECLKDLPWYAKSVFGENFFPNMDREKLHRLAKTISRSMEKSAYGYRVWRMEQKCLMVVEKSKPELLELWKASRKRLGNDADFKKYREEKSRIENAVYDEALRFESPYVYVRRGLKKEMIEQALSAGHPMDKEEFVEFAIGKIVEEQDGYVERERIEGWFRDYQSRFNKVQGMELGNDEIYGKMTGYQLKNGKMRKERKSKYDEIFKDMDKNQIAEWIKNSDLHRQMKKKLKGKYL